LNKDYKYIDLIRKLHKAERNFIASIPFEHLEFTFEENVAWEQLENLHLNKGLTKLQQIELTRLKNIRMDVYLEINELLGNEEMLVFVKEYMAMDKDTLEPKNPIGNINSVGNVLGGLMTYQTLDYIPIDDMPITYEILDHLPINDDNTKDEAYRVRVNSCEITINYDMYAFMEYIKKNYKEQKFHFATILRDLDINKVITKDYRGKPNDLFQSRKELLNILFENLKSPKGYWISRVQYWI
tara:strand:- start:14 stop:736 length:723 start_codon:yes stop_codon:yes gene_type:complete